MDPTRISRRFDRPGAESAATEYSKNALESRHVTKTLRHSLSAPYELIEVPKRSQHQLGETNLGEFPTPDPEQQQGIERRGAQPHEDSWLTIEGLEADIEQKTSESKLHRGNCVHGPQQPTGNRSLPSPVATDPMPFRTKDNNKDNLYELNHASSLRYLAAIPWQDDRRCNAEINRNLLRDPFEFERFVAPEEKTSPSHGCWKAASGESVPDQQVLKLGQTTQSTRLRFTRFDYPFETTAKEKLCFVTPPLSYIRGDAGYQRHVSSELSACNKNGVRGSTIDRKKKLQQEIAATEKKNEDLQMRLKEASRQLESIKTKAQNYYLLYKREKENNSASLKSSDEDRNQLQKVPLRKSAETARGEKHEDFAALLNAFVSLGSSLSPLFKVPKSQMPHSQTLETALQTIKEVKYIHADLGSLYKQLFKEYILSHDFATIETALSARHGKSDRVNKKTLSIMETPRPLDGTLRYRNANDPSYSKSSGNTMISRVRATNNTSGIPEQH